MNDYSNSDRAKMLLVLIVIGLLGVVIFLQVRARAKLPGEARATEASRTGPSAPPVVPLKLSKEPQRKEFIEVIEQQLAAFRTNDYAKAHTFAAAGIAEQYPVSAFQEMVKVGYPEIANSQPATFGMALDNGEEALVEVEVKASNGAVSGYRYLLKHEMSGWKINGVLQLRTTEATR
jgi:hypothetical protein